MKQIKFSKNWNNKLSCPVFTTIRHASFSYEVGKPVQIFLNDRHLFDAVVEKVSFFAFNSIPAEILMTDTGMKPEEAFKVFQKFYRDITPESKFQILTLVRR